VDYREPGPRIGDDRDRCQRRTENGRLKIGQVAIEASPGQRDERVLQSAVAGLLPQRRGGALCDDPAMVDHRDAVGDALRLLVKNTVTCSSRQSPRMNSQIWLRAIAIDLSALEL
jgi:hypothetical protein